MNHQEKAGCLGVFLHLFGIAPSGPRQTSRFLIRDDFLSPAERSFFGVLRQAAGDRLVVFAKVRVGDVLMVPNTGSQGDRNRIAQKHFDFLVCLPDSLQPAAAIELDDRSHT